MDGWWDRLDDYDLSLGPMSPRVRRRRWQIEWDDPVGECAVDLALAAAIDEQHAVRALRPEPDRRGMRTRAQQIRRRQREQRWEAAS